MEMEGQFKSLKITKASPTSRVYNLHLNRPAFRNALSRDFFTDFPYALSSLDQNPDVAVIVLSGAGDHFCSGIDLHTLSSVSTENAQTADSGRKAESLRREIMLLQEAITAIEHCRKPVIAAIHGACIGGGVDVITACDLRFCTKDAFFSVKEIDLAITADLGTLQRLPYIVGYGNAVELSLTGRRFSGSEAKEMGLVSRVFNSKEDMEEEVVAVAEGIAAKSPLAVIGTKKVLQRNRDLTLSQALEYVATWNSTLLLSDDLKEAITAQSQKRKPRFAKL